MSNPNFPWYDPIPLWPTPPNGSCSMLAVKEINMMMNMIRILIHKQMYISFWHFCWNLGKNKVWSCESSKMVTWDAWVCHWPGSLHLRCGAWTVLAPLSGWLKDSSFFISWGTLHLLVFWENVKSKWLFSLVDQVYCLRLKDPTRMSRFLKIFAFPHIPWIFIELIQMPRLQS